MEYYSIVVLIYYNNNIIISSSSSSNSSSCTIVFLRSMLRLLVSANIVPSSPTIFILIMEAIHLSETRFLQEADGVISQKTAFFIGTGIVD
jgi:hypothetical protein